MVYSNENRGSQPVLLRYHHMWDWNRDIPGDMKQLWWYLGSIFFQMQKKKRKLCENKNEHVEIQSTKQHYFQKIRKYHYHRKRTKWQSPNNQIQTTKNPINPNPTNQNNNNHQPNQKNPTNSVLNGGRTHPHLITRMEFTVRVKPAFQD